MITFWVTILALSILFYVLLDGFDLGVGILFGMIGGDTERRTMMSAVAPVWDGNETWLVVSAVAALFQSSTQTCSRHFICRCF